MSGIGGSEGSGAAVATTDSPRRHLSDRQADTVARLTDATVEELRENGLAGLTVRNVARRAEVARATAYTYFGSKEHLVTEVYWRRLQQLGEAGSTGSPPDPADDASRLARVREVVGRIGMLVADEPELAAAVTTALLSPDPDVRRLRDSIGQLTAGLLREALGPDAPVGVARAMDAALSGLMLQAGMGHIAYSEIAARMGDIATLLVLGARSRDGARADGSRPAGSTATTQRTS